MTIYVSKSRLKRKKTFDMHLFLNVHSSSFIIPPCKTQQRQESFSFVRYRSGETFKAAVYSMKLLVYETCK